MIEPVGFPVGFYIALALLGLVSAYALLTVCDPQMAQIYTDKC